MKGTTLHVHRCTICNKTDNLDVETEVGDFTSDPFFIDPKNEYSDVCLSCFEVIRDTIDDFEDEDEEDDSAFDYD